MTTLELLEATFPLTAFFDNLNPLQVLLLILAFPTLLGVFFVLLKFKSPLYIKVEYFSLTFCIGTIASIIGTSIPTLTSPVPGHSLKEVAAVLDTNFTVTLQDYNRPSSQFRSAKISAPAETKTVMVLSKPVAATALPLSFVISVQDLQKLESKAREQNATALLSKL